MARHHSTLRDTPQGKALSTRLRRLAVRHRSLVEQAEAARDARDAAILEADAAGWGPRPIAAETGLDPSTVQHIVLRETARRQAQE